MIVRSPFLFRARRPLSGSPPGGAEGTTSKKRGPDYHTTASQYSVGPAAVRALGASLRFPARPCPALATGSPIRQAAERGRPLDCRPLRALSTALSASTKVDTAPTALPAPAPGEYHSRLPRADSRQPRWLREASVCLMAMLRAAWARSEDERKKQVSLTKAGTFGTSATACKAPLSICVHIYILWR